MTRPDIDHDVEVLRTLPGTRARFAALRKAAEKPAKRPVAGKRPLTPTKQRLGQERIAQSAAQRGPVAFREYR